MWPPTAAEPGPPDQATTLTCRRRPTQLTKRGREPPRRCDSHRVTKESKRRRSCTTRRPTSCRSPRAPGPSRAGAPSSDRPYNPTGVESFMRRSMHSLRYASNTEFLFQTSPETPTTTTRSATRRTALPQRDPIDLGHVGVGQDPAGGTSVGLHLRRRGGPGDHRRHLGQTGQPRHRQLAQRVPTLGGERFEWLDDLEVLVAENPVAVCLEHLGPAFLRRRAEPGG